MSFANDVKKEISAGKLGARHCVLAETAAIVMNNGELIETDKGLCLEIGTDRYITAVRFRKLIKEGFGVLMQVSVRCGHPGSVKRYLLREQNPGTVNRILDALKLEHKAARLFEQDIPVNEILLMSSCCRRAFLAGSFLCCGTMSSPDKSYHLELVSSGMRKALQMASMMCAFDLEPRVIRRRNHYVVYIKEGEQLSDMLNIMQATNSLLEYENIRITREIRGNINRVVNCETANIRKTVSAARMQVEDIILIRDHIGMSKLSKELYDTAMIRLQNEEATLKELGAMMNPPVGKSGMNHRFQKLKKMADEIRASMEE